MLSALLMSKHNENRRKEERLGKTVAEFLHGYTTGQIKAPPEFVDLMVSQFGKVYGKEPGAQMKGFVDQYHSAQDLEERKKLLAQQPAGQAPPAMPQAPAPEAAAPATSQATGERDANSGAILQRLLAMAPQQAQPSPAPPAGPPNASRGPTAGGGIPLPPFEQGAPAGPAPQQPNPVAEMKAGSALGTQGFGGPQAQAQPQVQQPRPTRNTIFQLGPEQQGVDAAAFTRPGLEQGNALALGQKGAENSMALLQRAAEHAQDEGWSDDKAKRLIKVIEADPNFSRLPPLQQTEIRMRAYGIAGAVSNIASPKNLPASVLHGDEFPEGALTIDGRPLDRVNGWYRQQFDPSNGEIRAFPVQPKLTDVAVTTNKGRFIVSRDPRRNIVKVLDSVNGNQILDPAILETVRHTLVQRDTVDEKGNQITVYDPAVTSSGKVVPGAARPGLPVIPGGQPGGRPGGTATPAAPAPGAAPGPAPAPGTASNVPPPRPKALDAATRNAAVFAQTIQPEFPRIKAMVTDLNAKGKLGVVASRWSDFLAHKVGSEPEFVPLRNAIGFLNTALGRVHGGARGGGSTTMLEHFGAMQDAGKMDAATLVAALDEAGYWVDHYAAMGSNRPGAVNMGGTPPPPGTGITPPPGARKPLGQIFGQH